MDELLNEVSLGHDQRGLMVRKDESGIFMLQGRCAERILQLDRSLDVE